MFIFTFLYKYDPGWKKTQERTAKKSGLNVES